jgi:DNA-directed RNA polymerase subunit RPC12/RpoP
MLDHLDLFFCSIAEKILFCIFSKEETTETKKCMHCLRRIKISHYRCPYCGTTDFIFDTD